MKNLFIVVYVLTFIACKFPSKKPGTLNEGVKDMFPITSFIAGQVREVDSLGLPVFKHFTINNKTDSSLISLEEFNELAKEFMKPDINDPSLKKYYKETSFADQSVPSVTFIYSTTNVNLEVQRVDVIVHPDPVADDKVNSVYMEKASYHQDTSIQKKLFWKANKNFQIITSKRVGNQRPVIYQMKVVWDTD